MQAIKTVFVISVLTTRMIMPGMPPMPGGMGVPDFAAPTKTMNMNLTSDKKVDAQSWAKCAVPEGLMVGPKVDLQIDLPAKEVPTTEASATTEKPGSAKFVLKSYWDCSETVLPGQPKVVSSDTMPKGVPSTNAAKFRAKAIRAAADDGQSHAYWPNSKDDKKIVKGSSSPGPYELTTNYCGGTSITFAKEQEFLSGIDVTSPGKGALNLDNAIKVEWKTVPNALAYVITAFAGKDGTTVMWTSAAKSEVTTDWTGTAFTKDEIDSFIEKDILLPATATSCSIPAGIFKEVGAPMISIIALGADKIQSKDGIKTSVVVRSTAMVMAGRGFGGAVIEEGAAANEEQPADAATTPASASSTPTDSTSTPPAQTAPKSPKDKAKDALHKLEGILGR